MTANRIPSPAERLLAMLEDDAPAAPEDRPPRDIERLPLGDVVARLRELGVDPALPDRFRGLGGGGRGPAERLLSLLDEDEEGMDPSDAERRPLPEVLAALEREGVDHAAGAARIRELLRAGATGGDGAVRLAAPRTGPDGTGRGVACLEGRRTAPTPGDGLSGRTAMREPPGAPKTWMARAAALVLCALSASAMTAAVLRTDGTQTAREHPTGAEGGADPALSADANGRLVRLREAAAEAEREAADHRAALQRTQAELAHALAGREAAQAALRALEARLAELGRSERAADLRLAALAQQASAEDQRRQVLLRQNTEAEQALAEPSRGERAAPAGAGQVAEREGKPAGRTRLRGADGHAA